MIEDAELLRLYADERSDAAFSQIVGRHLNLVYSAALRRAGGDEHRAKDAVQQVFIAVARNADRLARHRMLSAWLYACTKNAVIDAFRRDKLRRSREQEAQAMQELYPSSPPASDWIQLRPVIDQVIDELNERDRKAVLLRFFEGRSYAEVGRAFSLTDDAARMRVDRALGRLRERLARRGITSTAAALDLALSSNAVVAAPATLNAAVRSAAMAAASTTPSGLGLLHLMSTGKIAAAAAGIVIVLAAGFTAREIAASFRAQEQLASANQAFSQVAARLWDLNKRVGAAESEGAGLRHKLDLARANSLTQATSKSGQSTTGQNAHGNGRANSLKIMAEHPEVGRTFLDWASATIAKRYGPFISSFGLSEEQTAKFIKINLPGIGLTLPMPESGGPYWFSTDGGAIFDDRQLQQQLGEQLTELLGTDGFQQLASYRKSEAARNITAQVEEETYSTTNGLTQGQSSQLTQILLQNGATYQGVRDWDGALSQAATVLSAAQMAALQVVRQQAELTAALTAPGPAATTTAQGK